MPKNVQTTAQLHSSHTLAKKCSKFSKPGFNNIWTMNLQIFKLYLEKAEAPEIKLSTFIRSSKKQESSRKTSISALLAMPNLWLCRSQQNAQCLKFSKPGFNSTWTMNFQMFKVDLEKAEKPEIKLPISIGSSRKQESSRKISISAVLTM